MLILMTLGTQAPPPTAQVCGPPAPALKGAAPHSASFSLPRATRIALREMPGAVVTVEEEAVRFMTDLPPAVKLLRGNLRLFTGRTQPVFPATPPMPLWMDPSVTTSGGNVVNRLFTIGGGNY